MSVIIGILLILTILILGILPFVIPTYIIYYRIYKQVQEPFGLTNFQCVWESVKDTVSDVFNFKSNEEADQ
jgi:hypothetical protein